MFNSIITIGKKSSRNPRFSANATLDEAEGSFEMLKHTEKLTPPGYSNTQKSAVSSQSGDYASSAEDVPLNKIRVRHDVSWTEGVYAERQEHHKL